MHWAEEDSVSIICGNDIRGDQKEGGSCSVKINKKDYVGKIDAKGTNIFVVLLVACTWLVV